MSGGGSALLETDESIGAGHQIADHGQSGKGGAIVHRYAVLMGSVGAAVELEALRLQCLQLGMTHAGDGFVDAVEIDVATRRQGGCGHSHPVEEGRLVGRPREQHAEFFSGNRHALRIAPERRATKRGIQGCERRLRSSVKPIAPRRPAVSLFAPVKKPTQPGTPDSPTPPSRAASSPKSRPPAAGSKATRGSAPDKPTAPARPSKRVAAKPTVPSPATRPISRAPAPLPAPEPSKRKKSPEPKGASLTGSDRRQRTSSSTIPEAVAVAEGQKSIAAGPGEQSVAKPKQAPKASRLLSSAPKRSKAATVEQVKPALVVPVGSKKKWTPTPTPPKKTKIAAQGTKRPARSSGKSAAVPALKRDAIPVSTHSATEPVPTPPAAPHEPRSKQDSESRVKPNGRGADLFKERDLPPLPSVLLTGDPVPQLPQPSATRGNAPSVSPVPALIGSVSKSNTTGSASGVDLKESFASVPNPPPPPTPSRPQVSKDSGTVWLIARDPFTLCAHWDLPATVMELERARNPKGGWRLRIWQEFVGGRRVADQPLPLDTTHRFIPVVVPGAGYVAEIGFLEDTGSWRGWAMSQPVLAPCESGPRDAGSPLSGSRQNIPSAESDFPVPSRISEGPVNPVGLLGSQPDQTSRSIAAGGVAGTGMISGTEAHSNRWVVLEALQRILHRESRLGSAGSSERSLEWVNREELVSTRRWVQEPGFPPTHAPSSDQLAAGSFPVDSGVSSAEVAGPVPSTASRAGAPGFWFRINAEVILYGSTERDAHLTIAGRPVPLREDGSFSFRFLLPDGQFELPVVAVNAAGTDGRSAAVAFTRATAIRGEVGVHPAPPNLKPPVPDALSPGY